MAGITYKIQKNELLGRYMVANKDLKQGELILKESPAILGPHLNGPARCFRCLQVINLMMCSFCDECNTALLCVNHCKGKYHPEEECLTLKTQKIKGQLLAENPAAILPLKCLLLGIYNPDLFSDIMDMEAHMEKRRDTAIWRRHRISVEDVLKDTNLLSDKDIKEELVQKVCGILDVNTFEVRPPPSEQFSYTPNPVQSRLRALYPLAALMAHDCTQNTHVSVDDNFVMSIYASVDIGEGEPILNNYANVLDGNQERHQHLLEGKYFICKCKRCIDPSEFGTEISSLVCHKCRKGFLRYTEIEDGFKIWKCSDCNLCFKDFLINLAIEEGRNRINDMDLTDIRGLEDLYRRLLLTFHPNHFLLLELKQIMVGLYSKLPPTKNNLNRKIDLCGRLMSVFGRIEPGISRIKALTMYELHTALVDIANKRYRDNELNDHELLKELETAERILKESIKFLLYEPPKSPEGRLAQDAMGELKMLRNSIKNIQQNVLIDAERKAVGDKKAEITKRLKDKLEKGKVEKNNSALIKEQPEKIIPTIDGQEKHQPKKKKNKNKNKQK
ncbi:SET domain-containing protein SmydA-8-like isoform X2 [Anthonomus grandis grandis]|uniref:SET domain-containing protein SmydA-8-like isoform X2 n=1 Tax=Anthonomus grandis grandis TaxID=2921223 RepID=UPI0021662990|nr:SET domain-containing protein SmydA-8-like isoform X2 [Anthonomus grandis grandis]